MRRPKIAIIHPQIVEGGGSEARALWCAEALKGDYDVSLITMGKVNLNRLNECYGTNLAPGEIKIIEIPVPYVFRNHFDALRYYRLVKFCKKKASEFDLMISAYNVLDFGKRGVQFIADFSFEDGLRRTFDPKPKRLRRIFYQKSPLRWMYLRLSKVLMGNTENGWKKNITIANSDWSGEVMKKVYGVKARTIYPPVVDEFPDIPWEDKEDGFVCIGRLVPEKRIEKIIEILKDLRNKGRDIHIHVIGKTRDSAYIRKLEQISKTCSSWFFLEGGMFGKEKSEFLAKHKFGIHGRQNEPFGIAVAEMVKAGCIVWAPDGGGQAEVVNHPTLIYENVEDAVTKIDSVLKSNALQGQLREHLANQSQIFSAKRFMSETKELVPKFLDKNAGLQG
jgi:glycosyltransferase involved in cell wall biosynthesis